MSPPATSTPNPPSEVLTSSTAQSGLRQDRHHGHPRPARGPPCQAGACHLEKGSHVPPERSAPAPRTRVTLHRPRPAQHPGATSAAAVLNRCSASPLACSSWPTLSGFLTAIEGHLDEASPLAPDRAPPRVAGQCACRSSTSPPDRGLTRGGRLCSASPGSAAPTTRRQELSSPSLPCDAETLFDVYTEISIPEDQQAAFIKDRAGTIVGREQGLSSMGWKIGDRITLKGVLSTRWTWN